jgi:hypothetical protein
MRFRGRRTKRRYSFANPVERATDLIEEQVSVTGDIDVSKTSHVG